MASTTVRIPYARRRWPMVAIGLIVAAFVLLTFLSNFYVDLLWYREVQLSQVFWTRIWAQAGLASAFFVTFFAMLLVNLYVTRRLAPKVVALTPEQEIVERFRENIEPYLRWAIPLGAAVLSHLRRPRRIRALAGVPSLAIEGRHRVREPGRLVRA